MGVRKMTKETLHNILDLYDRARQDPEYLTLQADYAPAQEALTALWSRLPEKDARIIGDYLLASISLYHRLLEMAFTAQEERTGSD